MTFLEYSSFYNYGYNIPGLYFTIINDISGVEAQSLTVWRQADSYEVPRICYLNKMDKQNASVSLCLDSIKEKLHATPLLLQLPLLQESKFKGVIDLLTMEKMLWDASERLENMLTLVSSLLKNY